VLFHVVQKPVTAPFSGGQLDEGEADCAGAGGGGYGGSHRPDGECGCQVFPDRHGHEDHADQPDRGSGLCGGCFRETDSTDHQCGRWHEGVGIFWRTAGAAFAQISKSEKAANAEALVGKNAMSGFLTVMNAAPAGCGAVEDGFYAERILKK